MMEDKTLFKAGKFVSHSGIELSFKIDCDALSDEDIACVAEYIAGRADFGMVEGIPNGGCRLAEALEKYAEWEAPFQILIVDDVATTYSSMEDARQKHRSPWIHPSDVIGWVIFARTEPPAWVNAVFRM